MFWIARAGSPWRDLPEEFGLWSSVYHQFRRWTLAGLWATILESLNVSAASAACRVATHYDKTAASFVDIVSIRL